MLKTKAQIYSAQDPRNRMSQVQQKESVFKERIQKLGKK